MDRHVAFLVRGRKFAYFLNDHHDDGIVAMSCRVTPGEQEALRGSNEPRFFKPAYLGSRGWIGLRLDLDTIDWDEAADYITESYWLVAPKPRSRKS
jgi:phosphoribosylglycinamide formyltransferase-1